MRAHEIFRHCARHTSNAIGSPIAFAIAFFVIIAWAVMGPMFGYSDTWQLVINTGTTIVTFLVVFMIQNTQNRDSKAIHLKLDELIQAIRSARNLMIDVDEMTDEDIARLEREFHEVSKKVEVVKRERHQREPREPS